MKLNAIIALSFVILTIGYYGYYRYLLDSQSLLLISKKKINVDIFDLVESLKQDTYKNISCRKSANIQNIEFNFICVHGLVDMVSREIWTHGVWERGHVSIFMDYLIKNPNMLAIDIGAQLGTYSLYAAASGTKVLAVEPFYDNILRIHKAAKLSNFQDQIVLITNALSDKRNEIMKLMKSMDNIGGQGLNPDDPSFNLTFDQARKLDDGKYYVRTTLLDDLVPYIPMNKYNTSFKTAIMKIDIEGFEPFAFQHASKFFNAIEIQVILMEWGVLNRNANKIKTKLEKMLDFLYNRGYKAYNIDSNDLLNRTQYTSWPWDILWKSVKY